MTSKDQLKLIETAYQIAKKIRDKRESAGLDAPTGLEEAMLDLDDAISYLEEEVSRNFPSLAEDAGGHRRAAKPIQPLAEGTGGLQQHNENNHDNPTQSPRAGGSN